MWCGLASFNALETYSITADIQGYCSASQDIIHLHWFKHKPTMKYFSFIWLKVGKSFADDSDSCIDFVTI